MRWESITAAIRRTLATPRKAVAVPLETKIGQMILVGFRGREAGACDAVGRDLAERQIGGVILFDEEMADGSRAARNIQSPEQVRALTRSLQSLSAAPLLVAIDQEGGRVNRLKPRYGFPETRSHEELGASDDPAQTFSAASGMARTLQQAGINFNLAPVVDLDRGPDNPIIKGKGRSFGAEPEKVARHALEFVRAHRQCGILTCAKHFPGHGSARGDTHLGLVDVTQHWTELELTPFQRLIEAGECDAVMTAHVFNSRLDPQRPATLSPVVLGEILRGRLGFEGVILSDDMEMRAIAGQYGLEQAIELGLSAGLDMLCFGNNLNFDARIGERVWDIVRGLVRAGKIPEERIDQSYRRIVKMKERLGKS